MLDPEPEDEDDLEEDVEDVSDPVLEKLPEDDPVVLLELPEDDSAIFCKIGFFIFTPFYIKY